MVVRWKRRVWRWALQQDTHRWHCLTSQTWTSSPRTSRSAGCFLFLSFPGLQHQRSHWQNYKTTQTQQYTNTQLEGLICNLCNTIILMGFNKNVTHRTQRVHWMQRVMMVLMRGPMFLSSTALFPSVKRLRSEPNCMDWSWEHSRCCKWGKQHVKNWNQLKLKFSFNSIFTHFKNYLDG